MSILHGLNPSQIEAVQAPDGPVLVLAGPGSGKTRVLTHRVAYLIAQRGIRPYQIMAVTFTNKAAREMMSRLEGLIGSDVRQLMIGTFHAICARILRRDGQAVGVSPNYVIYDSDDQRRLITRAIKNLNLDTKQYAPTFVHSAISRAKNDLETPETYQPPSYRYEAVARVFHAYEELKGASGALDFDDLLLKAELLFREHEDVRARYQQRFLHILVDEFQDTNKAQYQLVQQLGSAHRNVFVVGDEDQSIYSWRGADFRNVLRFRKSYPDAHTYLLEQNYRSTGKILRAAQAVIDRNAQRTDKTLWTDNDEGEAIQLCEAYDEQEEADLVAGHIERLIARGESAYRECAVMYRTNAQSRALEDVFLRYRIPYRLVGAVRFYQRREVKDVLAYLRVIHNHDDSESLLRIINVPSRGIGAKTVEAFQIWAERQGLSLPKALLLLDQISDDDRRVSALPFSTRARRLLMNVAEIYGKLVARQDGANLTQLLETVLTETRYLESLRDGTDEGQDRINNVRELFTATERYDEMAPGEALPRFLEEVALVADLDEIDQAADAVTLLTLHSAKGLEFDTVFIIGMEEGICPHSRSMDDPDAMEEERRLCYVGITRAKRHLHLMRAFRRTLYGSSDVREPSRFLLDIPADVTEGSRVQAKRPIRLAPRSRDGETGKRLIASRRDQVRRAKEKLARLDRPRNGERRTRVPARAAHTSGERQAPSIRAHRAGPSFVPGERVVHTVFGEGIVVACKPVAGDEEVSVAFEGRGIKRLMLSFAKLEKQA